MFASMADKNSPRLTEIASVVEFFPSRVEH